MTPIIIDAQVLAQLELNRYVEEQAQELAPEFEIDALLDSDFGTLYRLWQGMKLLGTFYQADIDGLWVAQPFKSDLRPRCETPEQAQFPIIEQIIQQEFKSKSRLIITLDRTQWKENNVLVIAVIYKKRAIPIYWKLLEKEGSTNLREQQAIIKPVLRLFKNYELVFLGDREFHGIELSYWLKIQKLPRKIYFIFRQKQTTHFKKHKGQYQKLGELGVTPGTNIFLSNVYITKNKGFGRFNLAVYWKRKYNQKTEKEPWFLITNLEDFEEVIKIYRHRMGIEAMFKDCKTGGYNLEGTKANAHRLTNLILLIAIAYTMSALKGQLIKKNGIQKYISRLDEAKRSSRRHSNFWLGIYGNLWIIAWEFLVDIIQHMMNINRHKLPFYQKGLRAMRSRRRSASGQC